MRVPTTSLRARLVLAGSAVLLVVLVLVSVATSRWLQQTLSHQAAEQTAHIVALLGHAVAAPLAQRDDATLQQILDETRSGGSIAYLVLWDHRDRVLARSGWAADRPLPARDDLIDLDRADSTAHLSAPVIVSGQRLGRLDLGLSTTALRGERHRFAQRALATAAVAMVLAALLLSAIAGPITRHLGHLSQAARRMADGHFDGVVQVPPGDEIARLAGAFNDMAAALNERITALRHSEHEKSALLAAARDEQARLTTLLGELDSGILFIDAQGRVLYLNQAFERLWGLAPDTQPRELPVVAEAVLRQLRPDQQDRVRPMLQPGAALPACELLTADGRIIVQTVQSVQGLGATSGATGSIWLHRDVTEERRTQRRADQALRDPLTRLLNRRGLFEELATLVDQAAAQCDTLALMFIDLDDFKRANDVGGHRTGDDVLVAVARTLADQMRSGETLARLGGDEFALACPGLDAEAAAAVAARLIQAVSALRFHAAGQTLSVGCSIGIARYPDDAGHADDLVARADSAMYQAKSAGKNDWALYRADAAREVADVSRGAWNQRIQAALRTGDFVLHFQPVLRASDRLPVYHEALLRMLDADAPGRLIPPSQFVPHAEQSRRIRHIDRWVFATTLRLLAETPPGLVLSAKLSAQSLQDDGFHDFLRERLQRHDVDPRRLRIELTEASAVADAGAAVRMVGTLRQLGCLVHLAHFGTGFHSFAQLRHLPVDVVKIDGSFIRNVVADESNRLFVASVIAIAHHQGRQVAAEHVEDEAALALLRRMGVDLVQGFHVGRPLARLPEAPEQGHLRLVTDFRLTDFG